MSRAFTGVCASTLFKFALGLRMNIDRTCSGATMDFAEFVRKYDRTYALGGEEYAVREALFNERAEAIGSHNCQPIGPWEAGVNHLTDWTAAELTGLLGHRPAKRSQRASVADPIMMLAKAGSALRPNYPDSFSWSNLTSIQETWDQGNCGSCWAIAAATTMRAHAEIKGLERQFSAHQMIACTPNPNACGGTGGCDGATAELAYEYVLQAGLERGDEAFLKLGGTRMACPKDKQIASIETTKAITEQDGTEVHLLRETDTHMRGRDLGMIGWTKLPENKEPSLLRSLVETGPVYVAVAAGHGWFSYVGGVLTPKGCDEKNVVNHAVVLYGYGIKPNTRIGDVTYWHIKNSWGPGWGEEGSIRLQRLEDEENACGWDNEPQMGSGCKGGPPQVWVCGSCGILYDTVIPTFVR